MPASEPWESRTVKREISVYEKNTLTALDGRACVMPGEPETEVEELIAAGFNPLAIVGVEQIEWIYRRLRSHYWDTLTLFNEEVGAFLARAQAASYSYIHLDYCGHFNRETVASLAGWPRVLAPSARMRYTVVRGRRNSSQYEWEAQLFRDLALTWCELGANSDNDDMFRWLTYDDALRGLDDDTPITLALMTMLGATFGVDDVRTYMDSLRIRGPHVPVVEGRHRVTGIKRFCYAEPGTPNHMFTMWVDLEPLDITTIQRLDEQWALDYVASILSQLTYATPYYHPSLNKEKS